MNYTEKEKHYITITENNLLYINGLQPTKQLSIRCYVASGNRVDVLLDGRLLAGMLTPEEAYYFIFGAISYAEQGGL